MPSSGKWRFCWKSRTARRVDGPEDPVGDAGVEPERVQVVLQGGDILPVEHGKAVEEEPISRAEPGIYQ